MPITPEEIEAEHQQALDSLTDEQRWALSRVQRAQQQTHFNHKRMQDNLEQIFEDEAERRNQVEAEQEASSDPNDRDA